MTTRAASEWEGSGFPGLRADTCHQSGKPTSRDTGGIRDTGGLPLNAP